ncbi:MAG: protein-glutamate O-methyltransferase CheR [Sulfurimonas sp.]|jgi:chemotaxis protein methyltransferase CheR|nr:protein-glutamate O-methyltransferase CheR [Sulfurimonas sp.]
MTTITLQENEFQVFQKIIFREAGIDLNDKKKLLVQTRLLKRLMHYKLKSYTDYIRLVQIDKLELNEMVNLLTTNETYFFREIEHFEFLQKELIPNHPYKTKFRVWSAAASVGAEAYSTAMLLDSTMAKQDWEILGTDINSDVIKKARVGLYPESWIDKIPQALRSVYCLKGKGQHAGKFLIDRGIISNMRFQVGNLLEQNIDFGKFNLIFLRNVLIYFDNDTKQKVVDNVVDRLLVGGFFIISHTENLNMIKIPKLKQVKTSIYQRVI